MDNPEPPPRQKRGRRASLKPLQESSTSNEKHTQEIVAGIAELLQVPSRPRRLSRRASNPMVLVGGSMALPLKQQRASIPHMPLNKCLKDGSSFLSSSREVKSAISSNSSNSINSSSNNSNSNSNNSSNNNSNNNYKVEKHVKFVPEAKKTDSLSKNSSSRLPRSTDMRCEHRRSLSVPASVRLRRPLHMMQLPPPPMGPPPSAHTFMIPPPIESLLCSSAAPLSLPYWLQPPGCRTSVTKSQNRIYQQAKLSSPAKSQGSTRQLRPVIKTGFSATSGAAGVGAGGGEGGSLSSGSGPDSGSDSEVSSQPRSSPPSAPKKVVTFNYLTQVQLVDI